jgi:transcriptional regulator with GAF, ATPase, and Fis domain
MIEEGTFREDLYYRLNVFPVNLPPLRDRLQDLQLLVDHFIAKFTRGGRKPAAVQGCTEEAMAKLRSYAWPGNVRELENIIERALIVARGPTIEARDLDFGRRAQSSTPAVPTPVGNGSGSQPVVAAPPAGGDGRGLAERLADEERREIIAAVDKANQNIAGAARILGINRSTLYYRMRKHGLEHLLPTKVAVGGSEKTE